MTRQARSERAIDALLALREQGEHLDRRETARDLLLSLSPIETGYVLRHVFGLDLSEAVHVARGIASETPDQGRAHEGPQGIQSAESDDVLGWGTARKRHLQRRRAPRKGAVLAD